MILNPREVRRRAGIISGLNRRPMTFEYANRLEAEGKIYSAARALEEKTVRPENITYETIFGEHKSPLVDPAKPRTASDYFLEFMSNRRVNDEIVEKHPLLAAFLDAVQSYEVAEPQEKLMVAEILAQAGATELTLCAALYKYKFPLEDESNLGEAVYLGQRDPFFQNVLASGVRLGIRKEILTEGLFKVKNRVREVNQACRVGLAVIGSGCKIRLDDEQLINILNTTRSVLRELESKWLYAAVMLHDLSQFAERRVKETEERLAREKYRIVDESDGLVIKEEISYESIKDKMLDPELSESERLIRMQYFLQVLPIVEEIGNDKLINKVKDAYFKAFSPCTYLRIGEWFEDQLALTQGGAEKHLFNVARLIREAGKATGLVPEEAVVLERVKSPFSIREKMWRHNGEINADLFPRLNDIFGVRILVPSISDIEKAAYLLRRIFLGIPRAYNIFRERISEHCFDGDGNPVLDKLIKIGGLSKKEARRFVYLHAFLKLTRHDYRKRGYLKWLKDTISNPRLARGDKVAYYYMVLTTYYLIPLDVQITTFGLEEKNQRQSPHWQYKLLYQLRNEGMGSGLKEGDFELNEEGVYILFKDDEAHSLEARCVPRAEANLENYPGHQLMTDGIQIILDDEFGSKTKERKGKEPKDQRPATMIIRRKPYGNLRTKGILTVIDESAGVDTSGKLQNGDVLLNAQERLI